MLSREKTSRLLHQKRRIKWLNQLSKTLKYIWLRTLSIKLISWWLFKTPIKIKKGETLLWVRVVYSKWTILGRSLASLWEGRLFSPLRRNRQIILQRGLLLSKMNLKLSISLKNPQQSKKPKTTLHPSKEPATSTKKLTSSRTKSMLSAKIKRSSKNQLS